MALILKVCRADWLVLCAFRCVLVLQYSAVLRCHPEVEGVFKDMDAFVDEVNFLGQHAPEQFKVQRERGHTHTTTTHRNLSRQAEEAMPWSALFGPLSS